MVKWWKLVLPQPILLEPGTSWSNALGEKSLIQLSSTFSRYWPTVHVCHKIHKTLDQRAQAQTRRKIFPEQEQFADMLICILVTLDMKC